MEIDKTLFDTINANLVGIAKSLLTLNNPVINILFISNSLGFFTKYLLAHYTKQGFALEAKTFYDEKFNFNHEMDRFVRKNERLLLKMDSDQTYRAILFATHIESNTHFARYFSEHLDAINTQDEYLKFLASNDYLQRLLHYVQFLNKALDKEVTQGALTRAARDLIRRELEAQEQGIYLPEIQILAQYMHRIKQISNFNEQKINLLLQQSTN